MRNEVANRMDEIFSVAVNAAAKTSDEAIN
jgi:hypothetical protein